MRTFATLLCAALLGVGTVIGHVSFAGAAEPAAEPAVGPEPVEAISSAQLQEVGLAGLAPISDEQGLQVRGAGLMHVSGLSFSLNLSGLIPAFSFNSYSKSGFGNGISYSFPGTLLGLLFGSSTGSGTANFGQGGSGATGL